MRIHSQHVHELQAWRRHQDWDRHKHWSSLSLFFSLQRYLAILATHRNWKGHTVDTLADHLGLVLIFYKVSIYCAVNPSKLFGHVESHYMMLPIGRYDNVNLIKRYDRLLLPSLFLDDSLILWYADLMLQKMHWLQVLQDRLSLLC